MAVTIIGSINRDIICRVATLPGAGETVSARETMVLPGGKGANQAIAAARMGAITRMIGAVGDDADGAALSAYLAAATVDVRGIVRQPGVATGAAYIALDDAGENQIIVAPGANAHVDPARAAAAIGPDTRVLLAQLETPVAVLARCLTVAGAQGACRILNAAPAIAEGTSLFGHVDLLILNQSELARYAGLARLPETAQDALAVRALLTRAGQAAIITLGAQGAVLVSTQDMIFVAGHRVPVVDTTGAGDCFCGVLAAGLDDAMPLPAAIARANAAAALCVGRPGAGPAMPTREEVDRFAPAAT